LETLNRISSLILITDGLSNAGLTSEEIKLSLKNMILPSGCVFNTFGFGTDHDSKLLNAIALKTQGNYYYVPSRDDINGIFGECVHGLLSTRASKVKLILEAHDGSRIITLATPFQIKQNRLAKEYEIDLDLMYSGEQKNILLRLSLRKMEKIMNKHPLLKVKLQYFDIITNQNKTITSDISITRSDQNYPVSLPQRLDENLNRFAAAKAIVEAIDLSNRLLFTDAQIKLKDCIQEIKKTSSGSLCFCLLLIKDLEDCMQGMNDSLSFQTGIHSAHALASMYFLERSSGVINSLRKDLFTNNEVDLKASGYGFITKEQFDGKISAENLCASELLDKYRAV